MPRAVRRTRLSTWSTVGAGRAGVACTEVPFATVESLSEARAEPFPTAARAGPYYSTPMPVLNTLLDEGGEARVLRGMARTMAAAPPLIFLATHGQAVHQECMSLLIDWGYRLETLDSPDELLAVPPSD